MTDTPTKVSKHSIQNSLTIALGVMSLLVVLSSLVSWLAFNRIDKGQAALLSQSLPAIRLVDSAVNHGFTLIDIGSSIHQVSTVDELETVENKATALFKEVNQDLDNLLLKRPYKPGINFLRKDTDSLIENIRKQLDLRRLILQDSLQLDDSVKDEIKLLNKILIDIKLISNQFSLLSLSNQATLKDQVTSSSLIELRFNVQQLRSIIERTRYVNAVEQVKKNNNDYKILLLNISNSLLDFDLENRKILAVDISKLSEALSADTGVFALSISRLEKQKALLNIQADNLDLNGRLSQQYHEIHDKADDRLDAEARDSLKTTAISKIILIITVCLSLLVVFLFSFFFFRPRLVERLIKLANNTRSIASNQYDIDIDIDGDDEIAAMASSLAYFRDELVEKQGVQKKLEDREKALSTILNNTVEGLFSVDLDGVIRTFNPASEVFFGAAADQVIGKHVRCLLPDDLDIFLSHEERGITEEGDGYIVCQEKDVLARDNNGKTFFGRLSLSLINLSGQQAYSCFLRDVSSEHEARERIDALIERLVQSNSDLEQFAYSCSHDLQEPVRMVLSFSELLEQNIKNDLDETSAKYLHYIRQGAKSAKQLIKDMLDYSRLDQASAVKEWMTLEELCEQVSELTIVSQSEYQGEFKWRDGDTKLYVISSQLVQLLTNLVTNGLKYNKSKEKSVVISCQEKADSWLLSVKDNGIGIDSRYNKKIFEVFSRLVSKREYEGSGIGLSICQKIAEKHGGEIWVESELGKGSEFFVSLSKDNNEQE